MQANLNLLSREDRLCLTLKSLYASYGYREYRLSGFDEYSLYAYNSNFFGSGEVISFSADGKLLALRPDVTLGIAKNGRFGAGTHKIFYCEKVLRKSAGAFKEVSQIGVEIIGDADFACEAELCALMLKTLSATGGQYVLDVSHTGIVNKVLSALNLSSADSAFALGCLESKNAHDFSRFSAERGLDKKAVRAFESLITFNGGNLSSVTDKISHVADVTKECKELASLISLYGGSLRADFSVTGDAAYYNGVIFKGYINGVPCAVLSGGRYDKLLKKFGKDQRAMGFALYLGELYARSDAGRSAEAVVIYNDGNFASALSYADGLRQMGASVLTAKEIPENFSGKVYYAEKKDD